MNVFEKLEPQLVWNYFYEITQIPRPSKKEGKIIQYLLDFGKQHNLLTKRDEIGNVLIFKPATKGFEDRKMVVLQSHIDMVCEKNSDVVHDFDNDPIKPYIDGEWVKAKGTTLGADDGIGIAAQLAVLASNNLEHGDLECLFTVDEETGLSGAFALQSGFMNGKILLNLDSEDEGELYIGCAGGIDTVVKMKIDKKDEVLNDDIALKISLTGLNGGHSGDDIFKGLANAVKLMNRILWQGTQKFNLRLHTFNAGNLRNALAREAFAYFVVNKEVKDAFLNFFAKLSQDIKNEFAITEKNMTFLCEEAELPSWVLHKTVQHNLLNSLYACPHGMMSMSQQIAGLVETSTNLASVKFLDEETIQITTSQRSSVESAKKDIAAMVASVFNMVGANSTHSEGYPGWSPNRNSEILNISEKAYIYLFEQQPKVKAIHAGLECGLFLEKYPYLDMISFGPTIKGAHSPDERINIETVDKFWKLLLEILKNIPANS